MSEPSLKGLKCWLRRDVVDYATPSESNVEIGRDGTGKDVPVQVIGRSIGSH